MEGESMEPYIKNAMHVLDSVRGVPSFMFKNCAGVVLLSGKEVGLLVSSQSGSGVAMSHKDGVWSAPVAVSLGQVGFGLVAGRAEKDVLVLLNPLAMGRLLKGQGQLKIGADLGFVVGKLRGAGGGADVAVSDIAGFGTSFVYAFRKGVMLSLTAEIGATVAVDYVNKAFSGRAHPTDILNGNVEIPKGPMGKLVNELHEKIAEHETPKGEDGDE